MAIRICVFVLVAGLVGVSVAAQTAGDRRTQVEGIIESQLRAQQPVEIAADTITVKGDVIHLKGNVSIWPTGDTLVRADEAELNQTTKRVQLIGDVRALLGKSVSPGPRIPPVDYR